MSNQNDPFSSIDSADLNTVAGGTARVASGGGASSGSNDALMSMITEIGNSIKDLASNNGGGSDSMMQMMMMMMMMGGGGGGGSSSGGYAGYSGQPTYVSVSASGNGGGGGCGCKGW